ncbi:MAG: hypothetical protein Q9195_003492 [Heterodermia aff. obscurata]
MRPLLLLFSLLTPLALALAIPPTSRSDQPNSYPSVSPEIDGQPNPSYDNPSAVPPVTEGQPNPPSKREEESPPVVSGHPHSGYHDPSHQVEDTRVSSNPLSHADQRPGKRANDEHCGLDHCPDEVTVTGRPLYGDPGKEDKRSEAPTHVANSAALKGKRSDVEGREKEKEDDRTGNNGETYGIVGSWKRERAKRQATDPAPATITPAVTNDLYRENQEADPAAASQPHVEQQGDGSYRIVPANGEGGEDDGNDDEHRTGINPDLCKDAGVNPILCKDFKRSKPSKRHSTHVANPAALNGKRK